MIAHLIERLRRDAAGAITHVGWYRNEPPLVAVESDVAAVVTALRDGEQVRVVIGFIIGDSVQISADGTTIVDGARDHSNPFRLKDVPLFKHAPRA